MTLSYKFLKGREGAITSWIRAMCYPAVYVTSVEVIESDYSRACARILIEARRDNVIFYRQLFITAKGGYFNAYGKDDPTFDGPLRRALELCVFEMNEERAKGCDPNSPDSPDSPDAGKN